VQLLDERRQRDVERGVADHHEHEAEAEHTEDEPPTRVHGLDPSISSG
jgi:hypothetical protein